MVEMKGMLCALIGNFNFRLAVAPETILPDAQLTIGMSSGLRCRVEPL